jgi:putative ABC transport system permease protein
MNTLAADLRLALRLIRNSPGFTAVAVLTLALGIGANTAIFSFVDAVLLKPVPYPKAEEIVMVWEKPPGGDRNGISTLNFLDWKNQNSVFTAMAAETGGSATLTGADTPLQLQAARVSAPYFDIFGIRPALGRGFAPVEDQPGNEQVVVLTNRVWQSRFGADREIVGRKIVLNKRPYTVVGVMPANSSFDRGWADLWLPLAFEPKDMTRDFHWMRSWARLKPGVSLEQARTEMKTIGARIERDYPNSNKGWSVTVDRLVDRVVNENLRKSLLVLMAAVGAVLLIGCANLANLLLARGAGREREVAIRAALGAGRWRMLRQFLTESVVLASLGGLMGLATGFAIMRALQASLPRWVLPAEANVQMDSRILVFTAVLAILTGVLFGIAPAFHAARADLAGSLKEGGRGAGPGTGRRRLRNTLIVSELALAFVLLSGAMLLIRSLYRLQQVHTGFDSSNVITMRLPMDSKQYPAAEQVVGYVSQVLEHIRAVPGVRDAAATTALPLRGWGWGMPYLIEGQPAVDRAQRRAAFYKMVTPGYFRTLGMKIVKGRVLAETDVNGSVPAAVINQSMAKNFKGEDPIGKRILIQQIVYGKPELGPEIPWQVVGIVADENVTGVDGNSPGVYVSCRQSTATGLSLLIRTASDPAGAAKSIQRAVWELNRNQAFSDIQTMEQIKADSLYANRFQAVLLGVFAGLALLLTAVGTYGVVSYSVAQRTHEIGIRAALGASAGRQMRLVLRDGVMLAACGIAIGAVGAWAVAHILDSLLFGVKARDPWTLAAVGIVLLAVAVAASYAPARRATRVDPVVALRYE